MVDWIVVCEARFDFEVATGLVDRVIHHGGWTEQPRPLPDWIIDNIDTYRVWQRLDDDQQFLSWSSIKERARRLGGRYLGYDEAVKGLEAAEIRKLLYVVANAGRQLPTGLLIIRDTDGKADRIDGYVRSVASYRTRPSSAKLRLCLGLPHPEVEAWLLNGFVAESPEDEERLRKTREELGFDATLHAHKLNPKRESAPDGSPIKRSTKRILDELTLEDADRVSKCWRVTPLDHLLNRGEGTRLRVFLDEIVREIFPTLL